MEEHENLFEKIQEILGGNPCRLRVLEQQIDLDLQVEYYECSRKLKKEKDDSWALDHLQYLHEPDYSFEVKKEILARLASVEKVECYRAIESYVEEAEESMKEWALLALNESRMQLESRLMEESQVFISTGLGGRDEMLRYFVVLVSRSRFPLTDTQRKVIPSEFEFVLKKYEGELEEVHFSGYLATLMILLPVNHSLRTVFGEAVRECNLFGDFLMEDFMVTNVRTLSFREIEEFLDRKSGDA